MTENKVHTLKRFKSEEVPGESYEERLKWFKEAWRDESPGNIIHSEDKNRRYKVRWSWFVGVAAELENAKDEGLFPETLNKDVGEFLDWYGAKLKGASGEHLTTQQDIQKGNQIIDEVLSFLAPELVKNG